MKIKNLAILGAAIAMCAAAASASARERWTEKQANDWFAKQPYRAGVNYIPAYAINSIEFWQKESFDIKAIEKEFALMESTGFNAVRVFLNDLVVNDDPQGFLGRFERFLQAADRHNIGVMVVFFTNGGKNDPKLGKQPDPDGTHNSGWKKTPSYDILGDKSKWSLLENYVKTVVKAHAKDPRVICWDIFNEPGNIKSLHIAGAAKGLAPERISHMRQCAFELISESAKWARSFDPIQPITFGIYNGNDAKFNELMIAESDVLSYHSYRSVYNHVERLRMLKKYNRPIMCKEWMGRVSGSTFNPILQFQKKHNIWSFAFGFVAGKMETWRPWPANDCPELEGIWFHDLYYADHTPYCPEEIAYIKRVLGKADAPKASKASAPSDKGNRIYRRAPRK